MTKIIVNLSDEEFCLGLTYTALTRCKSIDQLAFENMQGYKRFSNFFNWKGFEQRRNEDKRLEALQAQTLARLDAQQQPEEEMDVDDQ